MPTPFSVSMILQNVSGSFFYQLYRRFSLSECFLSACVSQHYLGTLYVRLINFSSTIWIRLLVFYPHITSAAHSVPSIRLTVVISRLTIHMFIGTRDPYNKRSFSNLFRSTDRNLNLQNFIRQFNHLGLILPQFKNYRQAKCHNWFLRRLVHRKR